MSSASDEPRAASSPRIAATLSRRALVMWLASPLVVVGVLWMSIDRTRARPSPPAPVRTVSAGLLPQGVRIVVADRTGRASSAGRMFLASTHNAWRPDDPAYAFTRREDALWQLDLAAPTKDGPFLFTITLGDWSAAERDPAGSGPRRRVLPEVNPDGLGANEKPLVRIEINEWVGASAPPDGGDAPGEPLP